MSVEGPLCSVQKYLQEIAMKVEIGNLAIILDGQVNELPVPSYVK